MDFEARLRNLFGVNGVVTTNSATSAEHLLYHSLKKPQPLDLPLLDPARFSTVNWLGLDTTPEVLASPLTCTATNWPILAKRFKD